ncbi:GNAT family N-acetyltransferase [Nocardioides sp. SYSU D00065]|uniref:GNAT family N-acetyltransferase n=1 Tax=Nocardioides sp. SYSU D00065 TaxID=2817378 RepID=UPI001B326C93|nr:GNAT family N-acetyltransferase [Nocardioides sp. SYSU D00065]
MLPGLDLVTAVTEDDTRELWPVYDAVFADVPDLDSWREGVWDRHVGRAGFRLARARLDGRLVGFAYGYTGQPGQWWTDSVADGWPEALAAQWLGGHFELVSIGVLAETRGRGLGGRLLDTVTHGLPHERWLLMTTADESDPARRLYASRHWAVLGPGLDVDQVVLGRRRPDAQAGTQQIP